MGVHEEGDVWHPFTNLKETVGFVGTVPDTGLKYGMSWGTKFNMWSLTENKFAYYFNHSSNGRTAGAQVNYDQDAKKFNTTLGLQIDNDDHKWKFRLHETGMMRAALQW